MTLTEFMLARIAEDEAKARAVMGARWGWASVDWNSNEAEGLGWRFTPARVLAECEAKRRIVEHRTYETSELRPTTTPGRFERVRVLVPYAADDEDLLRLLAMPYADHADYRQEWRP